MNIFGQICKQNLSLRLFQRCSSDLYEPTYLADMVSKIPIYDKLNIFLKGYDYPVLENYQKFVHKMMKNFEVEVEDCWAMPAQDWHISTLKPNSGLLQSEYKLKLYERVVQIVDVTSLQLPIIIRSLEASLPIGVKLQIREHEDFDEENRYIPDKELNTLKEELEDMGGPLKKK